MNDTDASAGQISDELREACLRAFAAKGGRRWDNGPVAGFKARHFRGDAAGFEALRDALVEEGMLLVEETIVVRRASTGTTRRLHSRFVELDPCGRAFLRERDRRRRSEESARIREEAKTVREALSGASMEATSVFAWLADHPASTPKQADIQRGIGAPTGVLRSAIRELKELGALELARAVESTYDWKTGTLTPAIPAHYRLTPPADLLARRLAKRAERDGRSVCSYL